MAFCAQSLRARSLFRGVGIFSLILLTACASIDPVVIVDPATVTQEQEDQQKEATSLPKAVAYGEAVRAAYRKHIDDQIILQNSVGLGLIGAAAAALGLEVPGESVDAVLGLGLGGAAAYTSSQFLTTKLQQLIYAAGAGAVSCSIAAMAPRRATYAHLGELKELVEGAPKTAAGSLRADMDDLQALIDKIMSGTGNKPTQEVIDAQAALTTGKAAETRGRDAIAALEIAGADLMSAITKIEGDVDQQIIEARPDLSALVASLSGAIPSAAGQITGRVPVAPPAGGAPVKAAISADDLKALRTGINNIDQKSRRINILADAVGEKPSSEALAKCNVDVQKAGLTFKLDREGQIAVDASKADQIVTLNASGGTPPYSAGWSGLTPTQKITINVEDPFRGRVVIKIEKDAPAGCYTVLVSDGSKGSGSVTLNVSNGCGATAAAASTGEGTPAAPAADEAILKIQKSLKQAGITKATVAGKEKDIAEDGQWGDITKAAIIKYLTTKANIPADKIPSEKAALIKMAGENGL